MLMKFKVTLELCRCVIGQAFSQFIKDNEINVNSNHSKAIPHNFTDFYFWFT